MLPRLAWGDAVGNQVRYLQGLLRRWGHASDIFAETWDDACKDQVRPVRDYAREAGRDAVLVVHHSFESRLVPFIARAPGRKVLVYHNVTPARLFEGFERKVAAACDGARDELLALRPHVERAFAYSRFSAEELVAAGYRNVSVLPFAIDWKAFDTPPDPALHAELGDGCANVLFVGRAVPSKKVDDVLRVFTAYQKLYQPMSRLVVAGYLHRDGAYGAYLHGLKDVLGADRVRFLGRVSAAQLSACFATATTYLSMSRHEGFGVPLLEAMYRGVPVVAYGAAAVPETMGGAGLTTLSDDPAEVAELLAVMERNVALRGQVIAAQRARLASLSQDAVAEQVRAAFEDMLSGRSAPSASSEASAASVELVCPGFTVRPDAPASRLVRSLAEKLPGARILALRPRGAEPSLELGPENVGGVPVWHFTADQPPGRAPASLPGSSSLETAVRVSSAPVVLLGVDTEVARAVLPHVKERAWGAYESSLSGPSIEQARQQLGQRLVVLEPSRSADAVRALLGGVTRAT
ncbi:glycosyltransferase [Pyxidicoccus fallax]|uniref:Glycosyltransferase n=1 Tax=Pyxidicoccus fallax TaxID=394095 RepID=A0A848LTE2_9BACT|nr:glycosyltransferase [Pyxidicoccus fallax]NPC84892.1 glycosyltransferase [Pyxidicoccus fallax]